MEYKIGDWVIYIDKEDSDIWKNWKEIPLYKKLAKIIDIDKKGYFPYLLEFKDWINSGIVGNGKKGHCIWCDQNEFKLAINSLKFKKWIKG